MSGAGLAWVPPTAERYPVPSAAVFVDRAEFLAMAAAVHDRARRALIPPPGEQWIDPEFRVTWGGPEGFFDDLLHFLGERLRHKALAAGHMVEQTAGGAA